MRVKIPFDKRFAPWMLEGIMILTARTRVYGTDGDEFKRFGASFQIKGVHRFPLGPIVERGYRYHGFNNPDEFIAHWNEYQPDAAFCLPNILVIHCPGIFNKRYTSDKR